MAYRGKAEAEDIYKCMKNILKRLDPEFTTEYAAKIVKEEFADTFEGLFECAWCGKKWDIKTNMCSCPDGLPF